MVVRSLSVLDVADYQRLHNSNLEAGIGKWGSRLQIDGRLGSVWVCVRGAGVEPLEDELVVVARSPRSLFPLVVRDMFRPSVRSFAERQKKKPPGNFRLPAVRYSRNVCL
jgi:hypothetical protein